MENSERTTGVASLVTKAKAILAGKPPSRGALAAILEQLEALAARQHLWSDVDYPIPAGAGHGLYLIAEEADRSFAVYFNVMIAGKRVPPHNHATWAVSWRSPAVSTIMCMNASTMVRRRAGR